MKNYKTLTLLLTYNCNLACDYCFCGKKRKDNISEERAKQAIDFFMERADEEGKVNLTFFGGEPLMQADLIDKLIQYCNNKYGDRFGYNMTTNGVLLNKKTVEMIDKNKIAITLSIDGMRDSHDLHRRFPDGSPSWDVIMKNIEESQVNKDNITIRLTFTRHSMKQLASNVISLHALGFKNLAFFPALDPEDLYMEEDIEEFKKQIDQLIDYTYQCYQEHREIFAPWFNKSIKSHIRGGCSKCMEGVNQMAITPDGYIYPCNRVPFGDMSLCLGNIDDGIDEEKLRHHKEEITKRDPECEGCSLKERCQGCHIENFTATGNLWEIPWHYCMMNQYVIMKSDELASKLYEERNRHFMRRYYPEEAV